MKKGSGEAKVMSGVVAAVAVGLIWTLLTGSVWPWFPIVASAAIALGAVRSMRGGK